MSDVTVRLPVVLSVMVHRQDPKRPGVINFRSLAACAMAANKDEAVGIGVRFGKEEWPTEDGWSTADVALFWPTREWTAEAAAAYVKADEMGIEIVRKDQDGAKP